MLRTLTLLAAAVLLVSPVLADVIPIETDGSDQTWRDSGSAIWIGQPNAGMGYDGSNIECGHIMPFELPDIGSDLITAASLTVHAWDSAWGSSLSLDLYALRYDSSPTTLASDMYRGPLDTSGDNGTPIMEAYLVKAGGNPAPLSERTVVTDAAADTALAAWIMAQYDNGAQPGDYVFLRISPDTDYLSGSNSYIYIDTGNTSNPSQGGIVIKPTLTLTTIPEPATLVILAIGGLTALRRRNRAI